MKWVRGKWGVLAAHDHLRGDMGLLFGDGGQERPDARRGAMWRALPVG
jgi:hypothetical protein